MLTWLNLTTVRQSLQDLWADELVRLSAKALLLIVGMVVGFTLLEFLIPPAFQFFMMTYLVLMIVMLLFWMSTSLRRLWLAVLIGTTVWALGWLALAIWSLMECVGS